MSAFRSVASPVLGAVVLSGRAIKRGYPVVVRGSVGSAISQSHKKAPEGAIN